MEVIQQAYEEIISQYKNHRTVLKLQPTHRYIKFLPKTKEEYQQLLDTKELQCTPFSLLENYDLPEGQISADCLQPDGIGTLYASVESAIVLPNNIDYEVIESYYTPYAENSGINDPEIARQITQRAATIAGGGIIGITWIPSGTIKVQEDSPTNITIPLQGVQVCVAEMGQLGTLPKSEIIFTNAQGYFSTKTSFKKKSKYYIIWQTGSWDIVDTKGNIAYTYGPTNVTSGAWNLTITSSQPNTLTFYRANAHRALQTTLLTEKLIPTLFKSLKVYCYNSSDTNPYYWTYNFEPAPDPTKHSKIYIWCAKKAAQQIVGAVNYQLGRFALFENNRDKYKKLDLIYRNSWGLFTRSYFTDREYMRTNNLNALHDYYESGTELPDYLNMQEWKLEDYRDMMPIPIFIDVYDNIDQDSWKNGLASGTRPVDKVCIPDFEVVKNMVYTNDNLQNFKLNVKLFSTKYDYTLEDAKNLFRGAYSSFNK